MSYESRRMVPGCSLMLIVKKQRPALHRLGFADSGQSMSRLQDGYANTLDVDGSA